MAKKNIKGKKGLKIGLYLQRHRPNGKDRNFEKAMKLVKKSNIDLFVFPEQCYTPFSKDMLREYLMDGDNLEKAYKKCERLSRYIGKPLIFSGNDKHRVGYRDFGSIFSIFVNPFAKKGETKRSYYIKHTQTYYSAFDFPDYREKIAKDIFKPIRFHGHKIGMTICYDGNNAIFSRMYGLNGADIIINSTGGNVMHDKWYKSHKARAIENHCYELVTMGEEQGKNNSYVYGFNPEGGELEFQNLMKNTEVSNDIGTIYTFDLSDDDGQATIDASSINSKTVVQPNAELQITAGNADSILRKSKLINSSTYCYHLRSKGTIHNIIFIIVHGKEIFRPEKVLAKLYSPKLKDIPNKGYVIVDKYPRLNKDLFDKKLELILKVRATENFCAVLLESNIINCCFQTSNYKRAQTISAVRGKFGIDIARIKGPETVWRDKNMMNAAWRENFEWLLKRAGKIKL
jgi:predicted amidohydrolase